MLTLTNLHGTVVEQFHGAADHIGLDLEILKILGKPSSEVTVKFPVQLSGGDVEVFTGYRIRHNDVRGPTIGGLRIHPALGPDDVRALATWNTWKATLVDIPFGGSMGGIAANPAEFGGIDLERILRRFTHALAANIGPDYDILAPDINTNPRLMSWILDTYQSMVPQPDRKACVHAVTGKPASLGGIRERDSHLAESVMTTLKRWGELREFELSGAKVIIQGFSRSAIRLAEALQSEECRIVAIEDNTGPLRDTAGLDISDIAAHREKFGRISGYPGAERISHAEFFATEADIFIAAASENQITEGTAPNMKVKLIVEACPGPTDSEGDIILQTKNIDLIPDILAGSGGLILSYLEWLQNKRSEYFAQEEIADKLRRKMIAATDRVFKSAAENQTDPRTAAYIEALTTLERIYHNRGIFP